MTPGATWFPYGAVHASRLIRSAQITFKHIPLEALMFALDAVRAINGAKLYRHLPDHREQPNVSAGRLVFHRLPDGKLELP